MTRPNFMTILTMADTAAYKTYVLSDDVLYGPIPTRRTGLSLGINLLPPRVKACTFNCVYCQCGWTEIRPEALAAKGFAYPSIDRIDARAAEGFADLAARGVRPDTITLSGNGEPTLHPEFGRAVDVILRRRDRFLPASRVNVLSNGTELGREDVARALDRLDERHLKLDAGDPETLRRFDLPLVPFDLDAYVGQLRRLKDVILQAFFCRGRFDNTGEAAVSAWLERVKSVRPLRVDLFSLARTPAAEGLERLSPEGLERIAARVRAAGIGAEVY
jgi:wyosine [tRNA(Phe)-imidazoG37] synthetase (radical SAM superfamily)